jgi:hypothetical protein
MKYYFCLSFILITYILKAQNNNDSIYPISRNPQWTKYNSSVRLGLGLQRSIYTEAGISLHKYIVGCTGYASKAAYLALEWVPTTRPESERAVYGLKLGYEMNASIIAFGLETKYQSDFKKNDIVLTPKIGLGIYGMINIFYGYNISFNRSPFDRVGHHQFSLVVNLNKHIINDIW